MNPGQDRIVRALTGDRGLRVTAIRTSETVDGVLNAQDPPGEINRRRMGELLTATVLVRDLMAPDLRVQAILQGNEAQGRLVADSHPDGITRGLVTTGSESEEVALGRTAVLQIVRTLRNGGIHRGLVPAPVEGGLACAFESYMQDSEQVRTAFAIGCTLSTGGKPRAGGIVLQAMPGHDTVAFDRIHAMLAEQERFEALVDRSNGEPEALLAELLAGIELDHVGEAGLRFGCNCSESRVLAALATLGRSDIEDLVSSEGPIELSCDFCNTEYHIAPSRLRALLEES